MPSRMLDTDICIYIIKRKPEKVLKRLMKFGVGDIVISSITWHELVFGSENSSRPEENMRALENFVSNIEVVSFDDVAAMEAGRVRAALVKNGQDIGSYDTLIAGHALANRSILVTNNEKHFRRVRNLKFENWAN